MSDLSEFELPFIEECKYWSKYFGLLHWDIEFTFNYEDEENDSADDENDGTCDWDSEQHAATICLCGGCPPIDYFIRKTAFHEVGHVFLAKIHDCLIDTQPIKQADSLIHFIIRTLENTIFEENYRKRFGKLKAKDKLRKCASSSGEESD